MDSQVENWQEFLQVCVRQKKLFSLPDSGERNEFDIMQNLTDCAPLRQQLNLWLEKLKTRNKVPKNSSKAKELRETGNKEFENEHYSYSMKYYTLSLVYAPLGTEDLSLALANRSAALFFLGKYEDCITDIELALEHGYRANLQHKLHIRAARCYLKLKSKNHCRECLQKVEEFLKSPSNDLNARAVANLEKQIEMITMALSLIDQESPDLDNKLAKIEKTLPVPEYGFNPDFPCASAGICVKVSPEKGRHVIATKDLKKGQVLFVEKPFAFVLIYNEDHDICANCCASVGDVPLPCFSCTTTVYCSSRCQKDAWKTYHQWECPGEQFGLWDEIGIAYLTIKTFLNCCYIESTQKFNEVQGLVTNIDKITSQDLMVYGVSSLMMALYLQKETNFFKKVDVNQALFQKFSEQNKKLNLSCTTVPDELAYVSALLLRHMLQLICNGHAITRLNLGESESENISSEYQSRVATAIYPSASMMNHSCDPNIINSFKDQWLIVKATKDIKEGDEVLNCYGPHYRRQRKQERQVALKNQYNFICKCEACTRSTMQNFSDRFIKFNCEECEGPVEVIDSVSMYCLDCEKSFDLHKNKLCELKDANRLYESAKLFLQTGNAKEALSKAKQCLEIRKRILYEYHETVAVTYDLVGKILAIMGKWTDSIRYLEYSIAAVEERYGSDSIELANELNKITDICMKYLKEETNQQSKQYKNTLKKSRRFLNRAEEILNLNYGPWNNACCDIADKQDVLAVLLEKLNL